MDLDGYSPTLEAERIFNLLCDRAGELCLPPNLASLRKNVVFESDFDQVYFPIPLKETETGAALKALEGLVASALADLKTPHGERKITINLEKTTCFLFQGYLATIGGYGKLDSESTAKLKDTDLLQAQSNPYRRMAANLYETLDAGRYYQIHGSLESSTTLKMIGLQTHRPDLERHDDIVNSIEPAVRKFSIEELEDLNILYRQAGVEAMKHEDFLKTPHGRAMANKPPWIIECLESETPPAPLPPSFSPNVRILEGIKVLELCRIIAGPTIARILAEYGADVLKVTSPNLSDVPFFQVDVNMGKHTTELDLKTPQGRQQFETLLQDVDIVVDGYRPGVFDKLGYGAKALAEIGKKRGRGIVYVSENCFGWEGEWSGRGGWQQTADCVSGLAWAQGEFLSFFAPSSSPSPTAYPIVPPFPISDSSTGVLGAISCLLALHLRSVAGGSHHALVSLLSYDLLLFSFSPLPVPVQRDILEKFRDKCPEFFELKHHNTPEEVCSVAKRGMERRFPEFFDLVRGCQPKPTINGGDEQENRKNKGEGEGEGKEKRGYLETWWAEGWKEVIRVVGPVSEIQGVETGFRRASRPNGYDKASWDFGKEGEEGGFRY